VEAVVKMGVKVMEPKVALSDEELWSAFYGGEESAYTLLYHRHSDRLYSYLRMLLSSGLEHASIDDVFQETWVRVFKGREQFVAAGPGSFTAWLFRIAHNIAISLVRRPRHVSFFNEYSPKMFDSASVPAYDPLSDERSVEEIIAVLHRVVDELPMNLRQVYLLSEFEHLNLEQIAEAAEISKANAKVRLFRARQIVREKVLLELGIEPPLTSSETGE
jgi:RNA polymerase sigma factor (sigma-70 family)